MKSKSLFIFYILFLAVIIFILFKKYYDPKQAKVCFGKNCFNVELAVTPMERKNGLMFRNALAPRTGMLFVFEVEGDYPFWMKNTLMPLDIIWINQDKKVVFIAENVQPCKEESCLSIEPDQNAKYVLEINKGIAEKVGIKVGDEMQFNEP